MPTATTARYDRQLDFDIGKVFFYLFMFFSLFLLVDPFYTGYGAFRVTRDLGPLKYTGLVFGIGALFFSLVGMGINFPRAKQPPWRASLAHAWPILLFGILVLVGSLIARNYYDIKETFLQLAIGIAGFPLAVILFWSIGDRMLVARRFMQALLLVLPVVIGWVIVKRIQGGQAFHTEIFLFIPLAVYFFLSLKRRWLAWGILLSMIVLGIASNKNTAYLVLLITLIHLFLIGMVRHPARAMSIKRVIVIYGFVVALLVAIAAVGFLLLNREEYLPSGNVETRSITYTAAINRFIDSPIYGTGFMDTTLVPLEGHIVLGSDTLVTHSDLLDVLSHGGLLGVMLFLFGIYRVFFKAVAVLRSTVDDEVKSLVHGLSVIVICGLVTASFNSPLITLTTGVLFWFAFGLLAAVADYGRLLVSKQNAGHAGVVKA
ncbi:MAG: O-antigen ligase family protein [Thiobacillus sp.]